MCELANILKKSEFCSVNHGILVPKARNPFGL